MPLASDDYRRRVKLFDFVEEHAGFGLWVWDVATGRMQWSRGLYKLLKIDYGTVDPSIDLIRAIIHPEDILSMREIEDIVQARYSIDREFRVKLVDGRIRWVRNFGELAKNADGGSHMIGYMQDITNRKEKELGLSQARRQVESLQREVNIGVWSASRDGTRLKMPLWTKWTGQDETSYQNFGWLERVHAADRERVRLSVQESVETGRPIQESFRVLMQDNSVAEVIAGATLLFNEILETEEWTGLAILKPSSGRPLDGKISGSQLRAARAILKWNLEDLAQAAGVSISSVRRIEDFDGIAHTRDSTLLKIRHALEKMGVNFIFAKPTEFVIEWKRPVRPSENERSS